MQQLKLPSDEDFVHILRMGKEFHSKSPYTDMEFDEHRLRSLFDHYLNISREQVMFIIAVDDGKPFGMIIGVADQLAFTKDKVSQEIAWWVDEDYRGSKMSIMLMKAYEDWARRIGCSHVQMSAVDPRGVVAR